MGEQDSLCCDTATAKLDSFISVEPMDLCLGEPDRLQNISVQILAQHSPRIPSCHPGV